MYIACGIERYKIIECEVVHNEGCPCVVRVISFGHQKFEHATLSLIWNEKIFATGEIIYQEYTSHATEVIFRCLSEKLSSGFYYIDRINGKASETNLHSGQKTYTLSPLETKIKKEKAHYYSGIHMQCTAKWIYDDEVIVDLTKFYPKDSVFPKCGKKIKGYEVIKSTPDKLWLYGHKIQEITEILNCKISLQKNLNYPLFFVKHVITVDTFNRSFFPGNKKILEQIYEMGESYIHAMQRDVIYEASFLAEYAQVITVNDQIQCKINGEVKEGKIISYHLFVRENTYHFKLRFGICKESAFKHEFKMPNLVSKDPLSDPLEEITEQGKNFIKLKNLHSKHTQNFEWNIQKNI